MATHVDKFLDLALRSGLATPSNLVEWCADFAVSRDDEQSIDDLCLHLIGKGVLTTWQCGKLRQGRWKGFFLDGYCFLRQIGKDETTSTYLCREVATEKYVAMRVTPAMLAPQDGRIHYELRDIPDDVLPN